MKRIWWIMRNLKQIWHWAGMYIRVISYDPDVKIALTDYVEFEVPGMIAPYDRMRLEAGHLSSCGKSRMGMSLHVYNKAWGGWNGGVIDYRDLEDIRNLISIQLSLIEQLSPDEKYRLQQSFSERRRLRNNPMSMSDAWPSEIDVA